MHKPYQNPAAEDELFFEMLKNEFAFFYALTVAVIDIANTIQNRPQRANDDV